MVVVEYFKFLKSLCSDVTMKNFKLIIFFIWCDVWLVECVPRRKISETIQSFDKKTGEVTAVEDLIQKYESEHRKFYKEETKDADYLEWPALNDKNLYDYCKKFLQHCGPTRTSGGVTASKIIKILNYEMENTSITSNVVMIQCKVMKTSPLSYYMTRAPEPNCVYAVKCKQSKEGLLIFKIIHKHCNFEEKPLMNVAQKRRRIKYAGMIHNPTGQPIANDKYLLQYELEHEELAKREGMQGIRFEWPYAKDHHNLDYYCYQYMGECASGRNRDGVRGYLKTEKLVYQKLKGNKEIKVMAVDCHPAPSKRHYYMTRALETNCVYALLRQGRNSYTSMIIIFKYCDFERPNNQETKSQDCTFHDKNVISKTELKEEPLDTLKTLQFFP